MKFRTLFLFILMVAVAPVAFGSGDGNGNNHNTTVDNSNTVKNVAVAGQKQDQVANAAATATAANGDQQNTQSTSFYSPHLAPDAIAPWVAPTAPCVVGSSGAGSWLTGAVSFGLGTKSHWCEKLETARAFRQLGDTEAAREILCSTKVAKKANVKTCQEVQELTTSGH
jgi:hypothetical protein